MRFELNQVDIGLIMKATTKSMAEDLQSEVKRLIYIESAYASGEYVDSIKLRETSDGGFEVFTDKEYGCLIGSTHSIYNPIHKTSDTIGSYKFNEVLSKDGKPHKILKKLRFSTKGKKEIKGIKIGVNDRNKLIVTEDHLILSLRNNNLEWIEAKNLNKEDYVFRKRSHNAIIDNSNKKNFVCSCGKEFFVNLYELKHRNIHYCSVKCRHEYGEHNFAQDKRWKIDESKKRYGSLNPFWMGGISNEPYDWRFNKQLKLQIKRRDNFTCQSCGRDRENKNIPYLLIHHIDFNKRNSNTFNLTTLCPSCHGRLKNPACSLPDVDLKIFKPVKIKHLKKVDFIRKGNSALPALYDLTIKDENSFVAGGILIHNSYLEYGTGLFVAAGHGTPHLIVPTTKKALSWIDRRTGKRVFAKSVKGIHPRFYFTKSMDLIQAQYNNDITRKIVRNIVGRAKVELAERFERTGLVIGREI